jgi:Mlc titration factor MtfA (ptsG expression regulator)
MIRLFSDAVEWEDLDGGEVDTATRLDISARASLLVVGRSLEEYRDVSSVLVTRRTVTRQSVRSVGAGIVADGQICLAGEARLHGPVLVVWPQHDSPRRDVVIHEFAHKLDMADGFADGVPPAAPAAFAAVLDLVHRRILDGVDSGYLDPYAGFSVVELFAVACEAFFTEPVAFATAEPELYEAMVTALRCDPGSWKR